VIHSEPGTQFTSWAFTQRTLDSRLVLSMGSVGSCFDNAVIESLWSRMQVELLDRKRWRTRVELADAIVEYLEIFHNRQRRHSALSTTSLDRHVQRFPAAFRSYLLGPASMIRHATRANVPQK
jgi:putative transposase